MLPVAVGNEIITLRTGSKACREVWAKELRSLEIAYSITLAIILLVIPLLTMAIAYGGISYKLWFTMKQQIREKSGKLAFTAKYGRYIFGEPRKKK